MPYSQFISIILLLLFIGCQPKAKTEQVNLTAEKEAIMLDRIYLAWKDKDLDAIKTLVADNGLFCGTDPGEFWNTEEYLEIVAQMLEDESLVFDFSIDKREVRVDEDGNSATIVEQFIWNTISKKIPIRSVYHFVKIGADWKFNFYSVSLIPKNADLDKLNKALE
ncbi:MAG: nuclear transport factor 2 family protein [Melioribacteraceae bacterium]|nr:nuclear transport factor 2 family protein [Melioribacteraceae bacterium]